MNFLEFLKSREQENYISNFIFIGNILAEYVQDKANIFGSVYDPINPTMHLDPHMKINLDLNTFDFTIDDIFKF